MSERTPITALVPDCVTLRTSLEAADALGWKRGHDAQYICCGQEVQVFTFLGETYCAKCDVCDEAIYDILGPVFGGPTVQFIDRSKVDVADQRSWVVLSEYDAVEMPS